MVSEQLTLEGDTTDAVRTVPSTMMYCASCEDYVLRSRTSEHDDVYDTYGAYVESLDDSVVKKSSDEPRVVGGVYEVTVSYSVDYMKRVVAADHNQAEQIAKDSISFADDTPDDAIHLHDDTVKIEDIDEEDDRAEELPGWPW